MTLNLEIPDAVSDWLVGVPKAQLERTALESVAAHAYAEDILSLDQVREMLGQKSRWEARETLSRFGAWPGTTADDVECDVESAEAFLSKKTCLS